jgi:TonB-linked SusC/RagA family outer membrane protein
MVIFEKHLKKRGKILLLFISLACISFAQAQERLNVSGVVSDQNGDPLVGVSVLEKGTSNGSITDMDGKYKIAVNQGATLVFSYIGYVSQEKIVAGAVVNVTLAEDTKSLEEVVVVGYGVQKKSSVTGAISQVKAEDMQNRTITRPEQALQGKTAGVQVITGSAAPGSVPEIRIRGVGSNVNNSPLYVIDGRIASDIGGIEPNDIESMEVLKDGASAAIYGIAAGNGVVLITTKKGKLGKTSISYDYQLTTQQISRIPKVMNSEQYIDYMTTANYLSMNQILQNYDFKTNTDWSKATFENSLMQRHNLAFQGGNDAGKFYLSLSHLYNDGYVVGDADTYKRLTATINADYNIKKWLEIGTNNQVEYFTRRSVAEGSEYSSLLMSVLQLDPLTPVSYAPDALPQFMRDYIDVNHYRLLQDEKENYYSISPYQITDQVNPFIVRDRSYSTSEGFNLNGMIYGNLKPTKDLVITSRFAYQLSGINSYSYGQRMFVNNTVKQDNMTVNASSIVPIYYQWENFANYNHRFGLHNITAMAGMSFRNTINYGVSGSIMGTPEDIGFKKESPLYAYFAYANPTATRQLSGGERWEDPWLSYFGRLQYDFADKYFLQLSLRADAASLYRFSKENRWGYFPAVSAGWTVSNEKFMENVRPTLSFLRLRASWGQNGNAFSSSSYTWRTSIASTGSYAFTNDMNYTVAMAPSGLENLALGWEKSEQTNIGLDARFFHDRLTLGLDWFNKTTRDLIVNGATLSTIVGNAAPPINAGDIKNTGLEVELGWRDNINKDFGYAIKANIATLKNEVTYIYETINRINGAQFHTMTGVTAFEVGYPAWYFRGYKVSGIDKNTGDPIFENITPDGVDADGKPIVIINEDDRTFLGSGIPDFTYGLTLNAHYKSLDLTVFGTGSQGSEIWQLFNRGDRLQSNKLLEFYTDRWTPENPNASRPRPAATDIDKYWTSDAMIYDGSFFKIKQIQIGYTLPADLLKKMKLANVRAYCSLDDFFTFTKYNGFDPETVGTGQLLGLDKGFYPSSKKVVLGINVTF